MENSTPISGASTSRNHKITYKKLITTHVLSTSHGADMILELILWRGQKPAKFLCSQSSHFSRGRWTKNPAGTRVVSGVSKAVNAKKGVGASKTSEKAQESCVKLRESSQDLNAKKKPDRKRAV